MLLESLCWWSFQAPVESCEQLSGVLEVALPEQLGALVDQAERAGSGQRVGDDEGGVHEPVPAGSDQEAPPLRGQRNSLGGRTAPGSRKGLLRERRQRVWGSSPGHPRRRGGLLAQCGSQHPGKPNRLRPSIPEIRPNLRLLSCSPCRTRCSRSPKYWTDRGCMVVQPFNTEVGAGTLNPATFLRVLGPEPWRVAYVEPSVRPDDARYGENPNRLQTHTQFQVILKPDPGNPQELYLGSLEALGIDVDAHDVRFVEDNWASPALGAWGLGWEVWLDGLEITQFTYFQQAGGHDAGPGVGGDHLRHRADHDGAAGRRPLQGHRVRAGHHATARCSARPSTRCRRYYLDDADVATNRAAASSEYAAEAQRMIDARPAGARAHLRAEVLARLQRARLPRRGLHRRTARPAFGRMRRLAREVAQLWVERRDRAGAPARRGRAAAAAAAGADRVRRRRRARARWCSRSAPRRCRRSEAPRPPGAVRAALTDELAATRLAHGDDHRRSPPRAGWSRSSPTSAAREPDHERTVSRARSRPRRTTPTATPTQGRRRVRPRPGRRAVRRWRDRRGRRRRVRRGEQARGRPRPPPRCSPTCWPRSSAALRSDEEHALERPEAVLHPADPLAARAAGATRSSRSRCRRWPPAGRPGCSATAAQPVVAIAAAETLPGHCSRSTASWPTRRATGATRSSTGAQDLAAAVGGAVDVEGESALIDQVTYLVEAPTPLLGTFDESYLDAAGRDADHGDAQAPALPAGARRRRRAAAALRRRGQRRRSTSTLVRAGNEAVLRARYEDAAFFWRADRQTPPAAMQRPARASSTFDRQARLDGRPGRPDRRDRLSLARPSSLEATTSTDPATARPSWPSSTSARRWSSR